MSEQYIPSSTGDCQSQSPSVVRVSRLDGIMVLSVRIASSTPKGSNEDRIDS